MDAISSKTAGKTLPRITPAVIARATQILKNRSNVPINNSL
jgi:hypothetical protein